MLNGLATTQSIPEALVYQTFASLGDSNFAKQALAFQHLAGLGVKKDCEKALVYYQKVAQQVIEDYQSLGITTVANRYNSDITKNIVKLYEWTDPSVKTEADSSAEEEALEWMEFREMKAIQNPEQLVTIGQIYLNGVSGVPKNLKKAEQAFLQATNSVMKYQRALALACLAKIYLEGGDGVEKDFSLAVKYVEQAVELDSNVGRATLGFMHMHGYGVEKDLKKAQQLFELSNKHGWFEGAVFLGEMYYHNQISAPNGRNYQKALQFFGIAAQQRNLVAMYYMGEMHSKSLGASRSCICLIKLNSNLFS